MLITTWLTGTRGQKEQDANLRVALRQTRKQQKKSKREPHISLVFASIATFWSQVFFPFLFILFHFCKKKNILLNNCPKASDLCRNPKISSTWNDALENRNLPSFLNMACGHPGLREPSPSLPSDLRCWRPSSCTLVTHSQPFWLPSNLLLSFLKHERSKWILYTV